MALKVSLTAEQSGIGTSIPEAYARVVAIQYSVGDPGNKIAFAVEYHWNEAARRTSNRAIGGQTFVVDDFDFHENIGIKSALYRHLKTLPIFSGAVDVLEAPAPATPADSVPNP